MLEKTLKVPLECKEIKPVKPEGYQSWIFIGRTDAEAEAPIIWCEELNHWKRPWCWERLKAGGEGDDRGWDGWMASLIWWTWIWASSGSWWWTGKPGVLQSMGLQRVGYDWVTEQNWKDLEIRYSKEIFFHLLLGLNSNYKRSVQSVQLLSHVWLFVTPWTAECQASLSITNYRSLLKLISIESVMPSNHLILCRPFLLLPSIFPSIRVIT